MTQFDSPADDGRYLGPMLEAVGRTIRSVADDVRFTARGWVARTPSLPAVHSLNMVRIVEPVAFSEAVDIAEEEQADLAFRHLVVEDERTGAEMEGEFASAGWKVGRELFMVLRGAPAPLAGAGDIVELTEDQSLSLLRAWGVERHPGEPEGVLDQLTEYQRREGRFWDERSFGVLDGDGAPLAVTKLRLDDGFAWVEDVFTMPHARRRGLARRLVSHVAARARQAERDFVFLMADEDDWPQRLYAEIGFRPVARTRTFHRSLAPAG